MAEKIQIRIKAAKNAPDEVAHGYLFAAKKNGHYMTDDRRFADHLIASGYGKEVAKVAASPKKKKAKAKTKAEQKPAESAEETKTTGGTE
jgi:hypothetical protein